MIVLAWVVVAILAAAVAVFGTLVVRRFGRSIDRLDAATSAVATSAGVFVESLHSLDVRAEIAELRAVLLRIDDAAKDATSSDAQVAAQEQVAAELAAIDRTQLARVVAYLDTLTLAAVVNQDTTNRAAEGVAEIIDERAAAAARADAVEGGEPGEAADVGIRSTDAGAS